LVKKNKEQPTTVDNRKGQINTKGEETPKQQQQRRTRT